MADSRSLGGRRSAGTDPKYVSFWQSSLEAITAPVLSCNSNEGFASGLLIPKLLNVGPNARTRTVLVPLPEIVKPPIRTLLPNCANTRVEIFNSFEGAAQRPRFRSCQLCRGIRKNRETSQRREKCEKRQSGAH